MTETQLVALTAAILHAGHNGTVADALTDALELVQATRAQLGDAGDDPAAVVTLVAGSSTGNPADSVAAADGLAAAANKTRAVRRLETASKEPVKKPAPAEAVPAEAAVPAAQQKG